MFLRPSHSLGKYVAQQPLGLLLQRQDARPDRPQAAVRLF